MDARHSILALGAALLMAASAALAAEPIKIGMFAEMTGANAEFGRKAIIGPAIAVEEINRAGGVLGRPLEIVSEDNQSTNPGSEVAVSNLLRGGDVKAIITSPRSTQILAVMPAIAQAGIPTLASGTLYELTHVNNPWIFRIVPHDGYMVKAVADFGVNTLKKKRWAIIHSEESFGISAKDRLVEELKGWGMEPVVILGASGTAQNFTPAVLAIKSAGIDIVATFLARPDAIVQFAKQLRAAGVGSTLIGGSGLSSKAAIRAGDAALHESYAVASYAVESTAHWRSLARRYVEKTGAEPDQYAGWAYDAVHLLALAIKIAGSTDPQAIRMGLRAVRGYNGVSGTFTFDQNGDGPHELNIMKNDNGKMTIIKTVSYRPK